jgi:hypothetical protein
MNRSNRGLTLSVLTLFTASALPACGSSSGSSGSGSGGGATTSSESLQVFTSCTDDDIADAFGGPGWDATKGAPLPPVQASYVAATTIMLKSSDPNKNATFAKVVPPILGDMPKMPGLIGYQVSISQKCPYARTLTVWKDTASMMGFVMSPNHAAAMSQASQTGDGGAVTEWDVNAADMPPTWATARQQIAAMGHLLY